MGIKHLTIEGYKSFSPAHPLSLALGRVTVFLGANGAGKSNLLSLFKLLPASGEQNVGVMSFYGSIAKTQTFRAEFQAEDGGVSSVAAHWNDGTVELVRNGRFPRASVYQFNDTSPQAAVKRAVSVYDCANMHGDGANLAAVLKRLRDEYGDYYKRIVTQIRRVMPQFGDFSLDDPQDRSNAILCWTDRGFPGIKFNPNQLSDGSLRFIALMTLLLLPPEMLPETIVLDEPEIGLHPKALRLLHGVVEMAAENCQILLSTQSSMFVNLFAAEEIVIVERDPSLNCSVARCLDVEKLELWLDDYSLSEVWEKNLIGGNP